MRLYRLALFMLLFIGGRSNYLTAQLPAHSFISFSPREGLPSSDISSLYQDSRSYIWIGHAAGVSRYDGNQFVNFLFADNDRLGRVYSIREDGDGFIWIGAEGGLFFYGFQKMSAIQFDKPMPVFSFYKADSGALWMATSEGPAYLSQTKLREIRKEGKFSIEKGTLDAWQRHFPLKNNAIDISIDKTGAVYVSDGYQIHRYKHGLLETIWTRSSDPDAITNIIAIGKDSLYFSSVITGVHSLFNGVHHNNPNDFGTGNAMIIQKGIIYYYCTSGVYEVNQYDLSLKNRVFLPAKFQEWGSCVLRDNESNFWIGTHEQLVQTRNIYFSLIHNERLQDFDQLYSAAQLTDGTVLIGANRGKVFQIDSHNQVSLWNHPFERATVQGIHQDNYGDIWFVSAFQGAARYHNGKIENYTRKEGLGDNSLFSILQTKNNDLYFTGDQGASKVIRNADGTISFKKFNYKTGSSDYPTCKTAIETPSGAVLLGSNHGLFRIAGDSITRTTIANTQRKNYWVTDMKADRNGKVWVSTIGDGLMLCRFNDKDNLELIKQLKEEDGLATNIYLRFIIDKDGTIWAGHYSGVSRVIPEQGNNYAIENYGKTQGFIGENYHTLGMMQDKYGSIWIPTSSGLVKLFSTQIQNPELTGVELNSVDLTDHSVPISEYATGIDPLKGLPLNIRLPYTKNSIQFDYNSVFLSDPSIVHYQYRLLNSDSSWIETRNKSISFRGLTPGKYEFQVRAAAGGNAWTKSTNYSFSIIPPIWRRWWFIAAIVLAIALLSFYLLKRRDKIIRRREGEKTELQKLKAISYQYQLEIEQVINYFATSMSEKKTVDEMLWDVARNCISKLGFDDCVIYLKDEKRNVLVQKAAWGPKTTEENRIINPIEIPLGQGIVGTVAQTGKAELINDTSLDSRYIMDDIRRFSELTVPMMNENRILGVIDSEHAHMNFYTERHLQILSTIASLCADKIDKMSAEHELRIQEMQLITLHRDLATSQLTALRAQMNPHFIFNALNSIQQYILKGDVDQANRYLSKFSRLQREVLNHCDQNFIPLEKEIEMLRLYLELEQLRFHDTFEYEIKIDEEIDSNEINIPPMILQPFVENAIWHGLMPKAGDKKVQIEFLTRGDELLCCLIRDNGIGREAAARLRQKTQNVTKHKSKGLNLVYERLDILQHQYQQPFEVKVSDITDGHGQVQGTEVQLILFIGHLSAISNP